MRIIAALLATLAASHSVAQAPTQDTQFDPRGMQRISFQSNTCAGFYNTPTWRCEPVTLSAFVVKATNSKALVFISHGSQGVDKRHSDYARHLSQEGINAVVIDHWTGRGLGPIQHDYDKNRPKGGDAPNITMDVLHLATQLHAQPEWANTKLGHLGESIGAVGTVGVARPYLNRIVEQQEGRPGARFSALVALYPGCFNLNYEERFLPVPLAFVVGSEDEATPAEPCKVQSDWINGRGGQSTLIELQGEGHDFDAPYRQVRGRAQNPAKCSNMREKTEFVLRVNGKRYEGSADGYAAMMRDCISMSRGFLSGHRGNSGTGFGEWSTFFARHLKD